MHVPVLLAYASHYQIRPVPAVKQTSNKTSGITDADADGDSGESEKKGVVSDSWCAPFPAVAKHVDRTRDIWATCLPADTIAQVEISYDNMLCDATKSLS